MFRAPAELSYRQLMVPELNQVIDAGTQFRRVPPYFDHCFTCCYLLKSAETINIVRTVRHTSRNYSNAHEDRWVGNVHLCSHYSPRWYSRHRYLTPVHSVRSCNFSRLSNMFKNIYRYYYICGQRCTVNDDNMAMVPRTKQKNYESLRT